MYASELVTTSCWIILILITIQHSSSTMESFLQLSIVTHYFF